MEKGLARFRVSLLCFVATVFVAAGLERLVCCGWFVAAGLLRLVCCDWFVALFCCAEVADSRRRSFPLRGPLPFSGANAACNCLPPQRCRYSNRVLVHFPFREPMPPAAVCHLSAAGTPTASWFTSLFGSQCRLQLSATSVLPVLQPRPGPGTMPTSTPEASWRGEALPNRFQTGLFPIPWLIFATATLPTGTPEPSSIIIPVTFRLRLEKNTEQAHRAYRHLRGRLSCSVKPIGPHRASEYALHPPGTAFGLLGVLLEGLSGNRHRLPHQEPSHNRSPAVLRLISGRSLARGPCPQVLQRHPGVAKGTSIDPSARGPSTEPLLGQGHVASLSGTGVKPVSCRCFGRTSARHPLREASRWHPGVAR